MEITILITIFVLKLIDCSSGTLKNLYLIQKNYLISALLSALGSLVWYITVLLGVKANGAYSAIVIAIATFVGSYCTAIIFKSKQKEKVWTFNLTMASTKEAAELEKYCKEHSVQYAIVPCLNDRYYCKLFSKSKKQSLVIKNIISNFKNSEIQVLIESTMSEA